MVRATGGTAGCEGLARWCRTACSLPVVNRVPARLPSPAHLLWHCLAPSLPVHARCLTPDPPAVPLLLLPRRGTTCGGRMPAWTPSSARCTATSMCRSRRRLRGCGMRWRRCRSGWSLRSCGWVGRVPGSVAGGQKGGLLGGDSTRGLWGDGLDRAEWRLRQRRRVRANSMRHSRLPAG